jgi:ribosomal protein S19
LLVDSLPIVWPKGPQDKVPPVRTQARSATILPNFVGLTFEIHNGKDYVPITITEDMVGHKLGEFSPYGALGSWNPNENLANMIVFQNEETAYLG